MWDMFWKVVIYGVLLVVALTSCISCALLSDEEPVVRPCNQDSIDRTILAAKKAGCKRYKIDKDEQFQTCSFICYESAK